MQISYNGKEKVDHSPIFDASCGHSHVDGESNGSEMSLDEELGISSIVTLGVRKSKNAVKIPRGDASIRRSTHVKYFVERLSYDGFSAHHYVHMVKIIEELELVCFKDVIGNKN